MAQNLENKGSEFFLPPRSMVLKVVRGKILETLKLRWRRRLRLHFGIARPDRLSKIVDYLIDNLHADILSQLEDEIK